jgi:hypothetical protein
LLLPLIDDVRRRICDYLSIRYGEKWVNIENEPNELPLNLAVLKGILKHYHQIRGKNSNGLVVSIVRGKPGIRSHIMNRFHMMNIMIFGVFPEKFIKPLLSKIRGLGE